MGHMPVTLALRKWKIDQGYKASHSYETLFHKTMHMRKKNN